MILICGVHLNMGLITTVSMVSWLAEMRAAATWTWGEGGHVNNDYHDDEDDYDNDNDNNLDDVGDQVGVAALVDLAAVVEVDRVQQRVGLRQDSRAWTV